MLTQPLEPIPGIPMATPKNLDGLGLPPSGGDLADDFIDIGEQSNHDFFQMLLPVTEAGAGAWATDWLVGAGDMLGNMDDMMGVGLGGPSRW